MQTQEVSFTVTKQDFRAANYYIYFISRSIFLYISGGTLVLFLVYMLFVRLGMVGFWSPSAYITSGAVFWLLWQMTKLEKTVRQYAKSPASILGMKSILRYTDTRMTMKVPQKAFTSSGMFADYPCAFESRSAFLVYTSGSDLFLIPRRAFSPEKLEGFRAILIAAMGDRFSSRYNKNAPHIPTAAELESKEVKEKKAAAEAAKPADDGYKPRRNSIADRANLVTSRDKNVQKKH